MERLSPEIINQRSVITDAEIGKSKGILHLGAHFGEETDKYGQLNKPVVWVEARPDIFTRLQNNISSHASQLALCAALGNVDGKQTDFYISNNQNGVSSSLYDFDEYGTGEKSLWPGLKLAMKSKTTLTMIILDTLLSTNHVNSAIFDYWVIDVQGAELLALEEAERSLTHCRAIYIEVSTVSVYSGDVLWGQLCTWLEQRGFVPAWAPEMRHENVLFLRS